MSEELSSTSWILPTIIVIITIIFIFMLIFNLLEDKYYPSKLKKRISKAENRSPISDFIKILDHMFKNWEESDKK